MREEINQDLMWMLPCLATNTLVNMRALAFATMLITAAATAQNLVPNGSFEQISSCPHNQNQVAYAYGWQSYLFSPDLFNACDGNDTAGVPTNLFGYQQPLTGNGYMGLLTYGSGNDGREIVGTELTAPLVLGVTYHVSAHISWTTGNAGTLGSNKYANNNLGMLFRTQPLIGLQWYPLPNAAHAYALNVITDSVGWTLVEGYFVADSAYQYLFVGNFFDDASTSALLINPGGQWGFAYYYVDDVCVVAPGGDCGIPLQVGRRHGPAMTVHPNPFSNELHFIGSDLPAITVQLLDGLGRITFERRLFTNGGEAHLTLPSLPAGPYFVRVFDEQRELLKQLLLHY